MNIVGDSARISLRINNPILIVSSGQRMDDGSAFCRRWARVLPRIESTNDENPFERESDRISDKRSPPLIHDLDTTDTENRK